MTSSPPPFSNKSFLLADDMKLNQYLLTQMLGDLGASLAIASDGLEAIDYCEKSLFDLIILDIKMPKLNGVEVCRAIRKMTNANATAPIVALTAHMFEEEQQQFFSSGMNAAVLKPVEAETFLPLLHRLLTTDRLYPMPIAASNASDDLRIDLTYLKTIGNNNASFITMMLASFLQNAEQLQQRLAVALTTADVKLIASIAHQLKFSVGVLGVRGLDEKLHWLQQQALAAQTIDLDRYMERSRRLQVKLKVITDQAVELHYRFSHTD